MAASSAQFSQAGKVPCGHFAWGMRSVASTVLTLVLFATYLGIGALAHDTHFSLGWVLASTALGLGGTGANHPDLDTGLGRDGGAGGDCRDRQRDPAVSDGGFRTADDANATDKTRVIWCWSTHFIAVTLWVECFRLLPQVPRERRIAFTHGLGTGLVSGLPHRQPRLATALPPICRNCSPPRSCC